MKKRIQDERVIQETLKQNSSAFIFLYFGVLGILLYKMFILQNPVSGYWELFLLYFGVTCYLAVRRIRSGLLTIPPKSIAVSAVVAAVVYLIITYRHKGSSTSATELIAEGIVFLTAFCAITLLMRYISNKKNNDMLKDK